MRQQVVAALDVGTKSLKMAVAKVTEEGTLDVLGVAEEPAFGVRKGVVVRPEEVAKHIAALTRKAEQLTSQRVEEVAISLGGSRMFCIPSHGLVAVSRADGHISQEDVDRVLQAAQTFSLSQNQEVLEVYPLQYIVDGEPGVQEPIGMRAVRLEADVLAVCAFSPDVKNLTDAVLEADLEITGIVPSPLAAASSVLTPKQKEMGVLVLELGAGTTSLAVFEEGDVRHLAVLPVGAENITNDLAIGLRTEYEVAERIKKQFGTLEKPKGKRMEKMELEGGEQLSFSLKFVSHIIEERVKEILGLVQKELKKIEKQGQLPGGVVLCGGGAKLPKLVEFTRKELKLPVKVGTLQGVTTMETDPSFLTVFGLLVSSAGELRGAGGGRTPRLFQVLKRWLKAFIP